MQKDEQEIVVFTPRLAFPAWPGSKPARQEVHVWEPVSKQPAIFVFDPDPAVCAFARCLTIPVWHERRILAEARRRSIVKQRANAVASRRANR